MKSLIVVIACAGILIAGSASASGAEAPLRLENPRIAVAINPQNGAIQSIRDKQQDVLYPQTGMGFEVVTLEGTLRSEKATAVKTKAGEAELSFTGNGLEVTLHYRLGAEDHFIEKWLEIKASDGKPYFLKSVVLEDMATTAFQEIHFHDDNTIWHCPINLFLRAEKGGCFAGIAYPYWDLAQNGKEGFRLGYQPNDEVKAGEVNVSEKYFIGVYRKEGIQRHSQGPYPGRGRTPLLSWGGTGLGQHFKNGRIPSEVTDVQPEVLDWGEVWAMQAFMQRIQPDDLQLPEDGYWIWQNGWWAGLTNPQPGILDTLKASGILDVMTYQTWYGRGTHPSLESYLYKMHIDPLGFPADAGVAKVAGEDKDNKPPATWHAPSEAKADATKPGEYTSEFIAPPAMEKLIDYGRKIGVHVNSFAVPGLFFEAKPEWFSRDEKGNPSQYLFGRGVSCPASDDYMKHALAVHEAVFTKYQPRWWGWDGRWLSYFEVAQYRPGPLGCGMDPCFAKNHGHLPGDNLYKEWKNIQSFLQAIREKHPRLCLEAYYGLKRGEPWALRHLNAADNYYETNGAEMNRYQAWHNQNDRFRPVYKNYCAIFGESPAQFQYNVISALGMSSYCQIGPGYKGLAHAENRKFLAKWRDWASQNYGYLKVKRDLFDCPGQLSIDGSAHIIKDRGFVFLFSVGGASVRASMPLNRWLQLEENPDALYQVKEVYPREGTDLGIYKYGAEFLYDMPKGSAVILAIEPAAKGSAPRPSDHLTPGNPVVIPAFSSVAPVKPREATYWHWPFDELIENGTATPDASPNKAHARLSGQELCDGAVGKALQFKAGNKGAVVGNLDLQAPATVSFWLKSDKAQDDGRIISQLEGPTTQSGSVRLAGSTLQVWNAQGWPVVVDGLSDKGIWQHVALVYGADGTVTGYLNGRKSRTAQSAFDFSEVKAGIGAPFLGQWGTPYIGALDDIRIYNNALTDKQITALYSPDLFSKAQAAEVRGPEPFDWRTMMAVAPRKRDADGKLLPLQSYDETIRRGMSFLLDDHLKWFKGPPETLVDEQGHTQMPWVYYSNLQQNGAPFANSVDRFVSYPAFHHALLIKTFIHYARYAGDERALKEAINLADWDIAHSTPGDWAYGSLPYSTYEQKKPGGFRDKTGLMPDKAAILALAYLELHDATGEARFLKAAEAIGHTLSQRQRPDGTWPFRVDPKTEAVIEEYTSSVIYAIMLFEKLDKLNRNNTYKTCRDKSWNWLVNGPIKTKEFRGFYEDIPPSPQGRTNYDCLDTIRYLLAHRTAKNGYLEMAKELNVWVEKTFLDKIKGFEPAEGIREQLQCNVVMGIHSLNWAEMLLELAKATGDEKLRQRAMQTANYITYYLQPDNRIVVGFQYNQWWYSCHAGVVLYLLDFAQRKENGEI